MTGAENGVIQYHLRKSSQIEREKGGIIPAGYCASCPLHDRCVNTCIRKLMHDPVKRRIVEGFAANESQTRIAADLDLHRSTVSYHVDRLEAAGVLEDGDLAPTVRRTVLDT